VTRDGNAGPRPHLTMAIDLVRLKLGRCPVCVGQLIRLAFASHILVLLSWATGRRHLALGFGVVAAASTGLLSAHLTLAWVRVYRLLRKAGSPRAQALLNAADFVRGFTRSGLARTRAKVWFGLAIRGTAIARGRRTPTRFRASRLGSPPTGQGSLAIISVR
jgi:hypothetical protein